MGLAERLAALHQRAGDQSRALLELLADGTVATGAAEQLGGVGLEKFDKNAGGTETYDSTTAWQAAVAAAVGDAVVVNLIKGKTYTVEAAAVAQLEADGILIIRGNGARVKLADGSLTNVDADYDQFVELLRVEGGGLILLEDVIFDHNRAGQTYPPTASLTPGTGRDNPGRGTQPRRTNGSVIVCSDGANRPALVRVKGCHFINGYLSGLMLVQVGHVTVQGCYTAYNTINGVGGASIQSLLYADNVSYRDGADGLSSARSPYDRCALQIRDLPKWITSAEAGFPMIAMTTSELNGPLHASRNRVIEPGAIGIFMRGCTRGVMDHNFVLNPGYQRKTGAPYNPYALWCDFGAWTVEHNDLVCETVRSGDMQPDGCYLANWTGDGIDLGDGSNGLQNMPIQGEYQSFFRNNKIRCGQANDAGVVYTANSQKKVNWRKGVIAWSMSKIAGNFIEGTSEEPIELINDTNYTTDFLHDVEVDDNTLVNTTGDSLIKLTDFGTPSTGKPQRIFITRNKGRDLRSLTPGTDARQCIRFSPDWATQALEEITIEANSFDCAWTGDVTTWQAGQTYTVGQVIANSTPRYYVITAVSSPAATTTSPSHTSGSSTIDGYTYTHFGLPVDVNYNGVRLYCSSSSKMIRFAGNRVRNTINALRADQIGDLDMILNSVDTGARMLFFTLAADTGVLRLIGNKTKSLTTNAWSGTMNGFKVAKLISVGNNWEGTGTTTGLTVSSDITRMFLEADDDNMSTRKFPRTFWGTAAPTTGTYIVGDTVKNLAPAAAGAPGWVCTTAGTPGTWKAMASLAA